MNPRFVPYVAWQCYAERMAQQPKFNSPRTTPPASGWKVGHRAPALGYGNLDGVCIDDDPDVSPRERRAEHGLDSDPDS